MMRLGAVIFGKRFCGFFGRAGVNEDRACVCWLDSVSIGGISEGREALRTAGWEAGATACGGLRTDWAGWAEFVKAKWSILAEELRGVDAEGAAGGGPGCDQAYEQHGDDGPGQDNRV